LLLSIIMNADYFWTTSISKNWSSPCSEQTMAGSLSKCIEIWFEIVSSSPLCVFYLVYLSNSTPTSTSSKPLGKWTQIANIVWTLSTMSETLTSSSKSTLYWKNWKSNVLSYQPILSVCCGNISESCCSFR